MADSSITTGDIEIFLPEGAEDKIEIVELKTGTELAIEAPVKEVEVSVAGDSVLVGKPVIDSTVTVEAASNKETVELVLKTNSFKKSDIVVEKGAADINVKVGTFKKSTVATGKKSDSVTFGNQTTVEKATVELGKGSDTVTFKSGTKFKGKSTIDLGKGGKDSVIIEGDAKKLTVDNFDRKDSISVAGETFDYKDIKNGAEVPGVKVNLA